MGGSGVVILLNAGRLRQIGIGRTQTNLPVCVVNAATGELLHELHINPEQDYHPHNDNTRTCGCRSGCLRSLERSHGRGDRI